MRRSLYVILAVTIVFALFSCSKKTTRVDEEPPPPPLEEPITEEKTEPEPEVRPAEETKPNIELSFRTVHFDFDKYNIRSNQRDILARNAEVLKAYPNVTVLIEGHCDERGTIEYNLALGEKRANTVKEYLENYGINGNRLSTISYGEQRPVDSRSNEEAWSKNRRAEFKILQR